MSDPNALAHRALTAAVLLSLLDVRRGLRVTTATLGSAVSAASTDLLVLTDDGGAAELAGAMRIARAAIGDDGVVAFVVSSPVTRGLASAATDDVVLAVTGRDDAYARAIAWAATNAAAAPAVDADRLASIIEGASACDLTLVEPDLAATHPSLGRLRNMRSSRARALTAVLTLGATARPLLFVPASRAPKRVRVRPERLADAWLTSATAALTTSTPLESAALALLSESATALPFKELLREARARSGISASTSDLRTLCTALHRLTAEGQVVAYAINPASPDWHLTAL